MVSFSINSLLSTVTRDIVTDGTGPVVVIRQHDNGLLTVTTDKNSASARLGTKATILEANGATVSPLNSGVAQVVLGTTPTKMKFINMAAVTLTGGAATATIIADGGSHTFIAGKGALTITGGPGANNYVYNRGSALMTIQDFSVAEGDILMIDKILQGAMHQTPDNQGGTMMSFGSAAAGIDVKGVVGLPSTSIHWV